MISESRQNVDYVISRDSDWHRASQRRDLIKQQAKDFEVRLLEVQEGFDTGKSVKTLEQLEGMPCVYIISDGSEGIYKIGRSTCLKSRISALQIGNHRELSCKFAIFTKGLVELEAELHKKFKSKRIAGEWFRLSDSDLARAIGESDGDVIFIKSEVASNG